MVVAVISGVNLFLQSTRLQLPNAAVVTLQPYSSAALTLEHQNISDGDRDIRLYGVTEIVARDRQTDRQTDRLTGRQTERQTETESERASERETQREIDRDRDRDRDRHSVRQTDRGRLFS